MVEKVIVAVDGGRASDAAVDWVAARSGNVPLAVELTTVVEPHIADGQRDNMHDDALTRAGSRLQAQTAGVSSIKFIRHGELADTLIALSLDADLLVIGAKQGGTLAAFLRGRLAHALAAHAQCVVVVVPEGWRDNGKGVVAAWTDDESADRVLSYAADEAARFSQRLRVLHVWGIPPAIDGPGTAMMIGEDAEVYRQLLISAMRRLRADHPQLEIDGDIEGGVIPVAVIEAAADAQLLVMGAPLHGAIAGFLLGSVSAEVLRQMPCPVAIIPRPRAAVVNHLETSDEVLL